MHTKHRHIGYHDFLINNIPAGSSVLDVGCGNGALAADITDQVKDVSAYAIDLAEDNIKQTRAKYDRKNINYSNVLEHLEKRVEFLSRLKERYQPDAILIRVPVFDRDWRVLLKREIGVDYRIDATHYIEYRSEEFEQEIHHAGLYVESAKINWGGIWAVVKADLK